MNSNLHKNDVGKKTASQSGRAGGRASRKAQRQTEGAIASPCPPGQRGGAYKPLSENDLAAIMDTAYRLLAELGMGEVPPEFEAMALAKGASLNKDGRLCFSRAMVEDVINHAPKKFVLHGRDPAHDFEIGGDRVYYGTGGAAVETLDIETGLYRASTLDDLYDFTRLIDRLENISWFTRCCVATDVPDIFELDVNTVYALLAGTQKHVGTSFTLGEHVAPIVSIFDRVLGGDGAFAKRPFCKAHISPVISPMRYGEDAVSVTKACVVHNIPINSIIAAQSGATAPAPLAGMLAQTTAETLAGLMLVNIMAPGHPMVFSNWPFVIDLRTGAFSGSGGEISILNAASAQIANHLGLPGGVAASMADAKAVDAQMGAEKALSSLAAGLGGANMIYESAGMMASLLGVSFEAFILDNEMLSNVNRAIRGIEVNEETLGYDAIHEAVMNVGHFLGGDHTMQSMLRDYYYPKLANRDNPATWAETGAPDAWTTARLAATDILDTHYPDYIPADADRWIRDNFTIHLQSNRMKKHPI